MCQVLKNPKRMYQEWPSVVVVAQGRCLRPYVVGAEGLVSKLHCFRLAKGFGGLGGYIGRSVLRVSTEVEKMSFIQK